MKFACKLIHGGQCSFTTYPNKGLCKLEPCVRALKKEKIKKKQSPTKFKGLALHWPNCF